MKRSWRLLLALLMSFALIAAACGDDDDDTSAGAGDETTTSVAAGDETTAAPATTAEAPDETTEAPASTEGGGGGSGEGINVGLTFDIGGRGDQSFNDSAAAGMEQAVDDLGVSYTEAVPNQDGSNRPELLQLQADASQLVIAVGFLFADAVDEAADNNPDTNFAVIDDSMLDFSTDPPSARGDNIAGLTFAEEQGSFLVGAAAALKTTTGTVGFIGGVSGYGLIEKFEAGFRAGVAAVDPDIEVVSDYITEFPDFDGFVAPDRAREIALAMYEQGADIVYHAAGASGAGLFEAAKSQSDSSGEKVWAIGVDSDQFNTASPEVQEFILTSMLKRVDVAVFNITKDQVDGTFPGGQNIVYDLSVDGVGYSTSGGFIDDITDQLEEFKTGIVSGDIVVPTEP
jgi:basic membrane protein A and related proteins